MPVGEMVYKVHRYHFGILRFVRCYNGSSGRWPEGARGWQRRMRRRNRRRNDLFTLHFQFVLFFFFISFHLPSFTKTALNMHNKYTLTCRIHTYIHVLYEGISILFLNFFCVMFNNNKTKNPIKKYQKQYLLSIWLSFGIWIGRFQP